MANIKSSEKANRQRITRTARNTAQKTAMRTVIKRLRAAIGAKKAKEAQTLLKSAVSAIDSAASKGVIKRGTASRSNLAPDRRRLRHEGLRAPAARRSVPLARFATTSSAVAEHPRFARERLSSGPREAREPDYRSGL